MAFILMLDVILNEKMSNFYLDDKKRKFYDEALSLIRACGNEFWDLDENLSKHIDKINCNKKVRTMYSRKGRNRVGYGQESYLTICYTKEVETIFREKVVPSLASLYENKTNCEFVVYYENPKIGEKNEESASFLKYIEHPDYWNVFNIKFELKGGSSIEHDEFWNFLSETLSKV